MRDFHAPDDHPTPILDFVTLEGRKAVRDSLTKHHPELVTACTAHGPATAAELARHKAHCEDVAAMAVPGTEDSDTVPPAPVAETLEEFLLTDRYWHGLHRVPAPPQEAS